MSLRAPEARLPTKNVEGRVAYTLIDSDFVTPCGGVGIFDILKMIAGSLFPNSDLSKEKEPEFDLFKFCSTLYRFVQDKKIPREIFVLRLGVFAPWR